MVTYPTHLEQKWARERERAIQRLREAQKACKSPNPVDRNYAYMSANCEHGDWQMVGWGPGGCPQCGTPATCGILSPNRMVSILSDEVE